MRSPDMCDPVRAALADSKCLLIAKMYIASSSKGTVQVDSLHASLLELALQKVCMLRQHLRIK